VHAYAEMLKSLRTLLNNNDMQACALCAEIRQSCAPHLDARFDALAETIDRLDFSQAQVQCTHLLHSYRH
jgi:hypothetical protein